MIPEREDARPVIREVIVVEGKDDVAAVKRACRAQTIITNGLGISREIIEEIRIAALRCGVIVLTDPDAPGEKIRQIINRQVPGCRQAYLPPGRYSRNGLVGVEYAKPAEIWAALTAAKATKSEKQPDAFTMAEIVNMGLAGAEGAGEKRERLSLLLGIGRPNGKQFLRRLNDYGVSKQDFIAAYREMMRDDGESV
ncbi:MAG: ribonuclease M5 [Clostridiales bacterium]|nr:ribonuclease M5 [Clostridiales bacterium]